MRYLTLLKAVPPTTPPPPELMAAIARLGEEATASGALIDFAGLAPGELGAQVGVSDGVLTVTDGPFAESKEIISYAVYEVSSKEEAVEWASRFLRAHTESWPGWQGEIDVLQVFAPPA